MSSKVQQTTATGKQPLKQAIINDLKDVKKSPVGYFDFFSGTFWALGQTLGFLIGVAFSSLLPIVMLIIGSIYLGQCTVEPNIPIYLIVAGVFGILKSTLTIINQKRVTKLRSELHDEKATLPNGDPLNLLGSLLSLFLFIWFIVGSVWVFRNANPYPKFYETKSDSYCHKGLYLFSFITLIILWILTFVGIFFMCFCCCCLTCCAVVGAAAGNVEASGDSSRPGDPKLRDSDEPTSVRIITNDTH